MKKMVSLLLLALMILSFSGCGDVSTVNEARSDALSYDDAVKELESFCNQIHSRSVEPTLDINMDEGTVASSLADIDTFDIAVQGYGSIDIEIAAATEISSSAPDDWINVVAERFNNSGQEINGRSVSVSVRTITSGEALTYITDGGYRPDVFLPSNDAWIKMLDASGTTTIPLADRLAGNTAGILMKKDVYDGFVEKYGDVSVDKVLEAAIAGDLVFGYTNPYTSSTGLNILSQMLYSFDNTNPLSDKAVSKLVDYQKKAPTAAYTTAVLRNSAARGTISAMVMEEQAYVNTPELSDFVYTPAGIRHDHPAVTFDYVSEEKQEAAKLFIEYCLSEECQKLATDRGFNRHDDYAGEENGMDGKTYLAAQRVWKTNKNGGKPVVAVFVSDISGSMTGSRITSLKQSLLSSMQYIDSSNYIGLVSYNDNVYIDLPIKQFDAQQRAYFSGAIKSLTPAGGTATYDAMLVGLKMLLDASKEITDAKPMLFVLSDGEQNSGYNLNRVTPIVGGLSIPVYTIGYEMEEGSKADLLKLAQINEASCIDADVDGIVNDLRNLFNVNM